TSVDGSAAGNGADVIRFAPAIAGGTVTLRTIGGIKLGPSALVINSRITLAGTGETIPRDGAAAAFRLFLVDQGGNPTLQDLPLSKGLAGGGNGGDIGRGGGGGGAAGLGGSIFNQGTLNLTGVTLTANTAQGGRGGNSGNNAAGGSGGGGL